MKARALVIGLLFVAVLFASHGTAAAQSRDSACAIVSVSIVTGTSTVIPGTTIGIGGGLRNCSSRKARYTLIVSGTSSCGQKAEIASRRMALNPGENTIWSVSYPMPAETCAGIWEVTAQVQEGRENGGPAVGLSSSALAAATTTIIVE